MTARLNLTVGTSFLLAGAISFLLLPGAHAEPAGFKSLFNGKDLSGWEGVEGAWEVKDGAIRCKGTDGDRNWLIWRGGQPENFVLKLKFKFIAGNSGVQVRSREIEPFKVCGYQVEVAEQNKMGLWHHSLAPEKYRSHLAEAGERARISPEGEKTVEKFADAADVQAAFKEDGWNEMEIIAEGPKLIQKVNGVVLAELIDEDAKHATRTGWIALQDHGHGTIAEFKDIELKAME